MEDEVGRGNFDDDVQMNMDSSIIDIEQGRDAPSALQDVPSSAQMPWNISHSLHSKRHSSAHPASQAASRRHLSASPLIGRGSVLPDQFAVDDDQILYGRSDDGNDDDAFSRHAPPSHSKSNIGPGASVGMSSSQVAEEFELFGPAANVDTQTAGTSKWVREALDHESGNFFDYVRNTIEEKNEDPLSQESNVDGAEKKAHVTFEELFYPKKNTHVVAAQAFYHILCLATKGKIWVEQDNGIREDDDNDDDEVAGLFQPFGAIRIGVSV